MTLPTSMITPSVLTDLRGRIDGDVVGPDDPDHRSASRAWNTRYTHAPALAVLPTSVSDVVESVRFAAAAGITVAVQTTGHGVTREATGVLLLNLRHLNDVRVDAAARRAWVAGGATWQPVLDAATPYGLAPLVGSSPHVGAVGYTLGGGAGWLARRYGLSIDSVNCFEVVTADGRLRTASPVEEPDLFWALRGAGMGNLGVVTGMEVELHAVADVYGGNLFYPAEAAGDVLARWRAWLPTVPDELTSAVVLMNYPPVDVVPEPLRGRSFAIVRGAFCGRPDDGELLMAHWRDWQTPLIDTFASLPFARIADVSQDPVDPMPVTGHGMWLDELTPAAISTIVHGVFSTGGPPALTFAEIRHAGGVVSRVAGDAGVYGNRAASLLLNLVGRVPTREVALHVEAGIEAVARGVGEAVSGRYLNFLDGAARRRHAAAGLVPGATERLERLKSQLDPYGLFAHGLDLTSSLSAVRGAPVQR